jgi:transcriptional regulator with XRE-family HTH domain
MPSLRELDPSASPLALFGAALRRARLRRGWSQEATGRKIGPVSGDLISKIENGDRAPSPEMVELCDKIFPEMAGLFAWIYELARKSGKVPVWFAGWIDAEGEATFLRWWEALQMPGLVQTEAYARSILGEDRSNTEDTLDELVSVRLERQKIFDRANPPMLLVVLDEAVLHRCIGSPKIMHDQLVHLADMAERPNITVQIVPASVGKHAGLLGAFAIAEFDDKPSIVYLETSANGQVVEKSSVVARVTMRLDSLRAVALPKDDSRDLILKVAEQEWT